MEQGPPESRKIWLVRALREAIATGELRPGTRLVERDISSRTGVSRGPVREALAQLEQEGLVVSHTYRGAEVLGVSQEEVEQILVPTRVVLEQFAFRHAIPRLDSADFARLHELVEAMSTAALADDHESIVEADIQFHELVIVKSGWPHCEQIWRTIVPRVRAYFYDDAPHHASLSDIAIEHQELLSVMRTSNEAKITLEVERHIRMRPSFGGYGAASPADTERPPAGHL
jgi:DNA-binding GntR family transcriptional regulator